MADAVIDEVTDFENATSVALHRVAQAFADFRNEEDCEYHKISRRLLDNADEINEILSNARVEEKAQKAQLIVNIAANTLRKTGEIGRASCRERV